MEKSTELNKLRNKLFNNNSGNEVYNLCAAMEVVGGYSELMNMPIPALIEVFKYLEYINKQSEKGMPRGKK